MPDAAALIAEFQDAPPARGPQRLRYTHKAMVDMIVENPGIRQYELAQAFGMSQSWISTVMATDAFQAQLDLRQEELVDPQIRASIRERFQAATTRSLEVLQEKLSQPSSNIPDNLVLRAIELGAKGLGVGGFAAAAPPSAPAPSGDRLAVLAERLLTLQREVRSANVTDVEVKEIVQ